MTTISAKNNKTFWLRRLAGEPVALSGEEPEYGYYRSKTANGWDALAFYYDANDKVVCLKNGKPVDDYVAIDNLWKRAAENPVTKERYLDVVRDGKPWPDLNEAVTRSNQAPADDSLEGLKAAIEELERDAEAWIKKGAALTEDAAHQASDLANRLGQLRKRADEAREREKAPHLRAGREVDDRWRPVIAAADIYARLKDIVVKPWLVAENRRKAAAEAEARRQAEEAAARARKAEREAQEAAEAAARAAQPAVAEAIAAAAEQEAEVATRQATEAKAVADRIAAQTVTAGTRGRGTALRSAPEFEIADRDAMIAFFRDRDEMTELLLKMAKAAHRAKIAVPGLKVTEDSKAA